MIVCPGSSATIRHPAGHHSCAGTGEPTSYRAGPWVRSSMTVPCARIFPPLMIPTRSHNRCTKSN